MVFSSTGKKPIVAPYSGAMLAMVARSGSASVRVPAPKNSTNLPTTLCWRSSSVTVSTRSVAVTPSRSWPASSTPTTSGVRKYTGRPATRPPRGMWARQFPPHHIGREKVHRLAQHRGLGLDAAHAPADHADAVDHRGVAVGADQRIGIMNAVSGLMHAARQILQIDLVHDAEAR